MKFSISTLLVLSIFLISCKVEPEKINYGADACNFCKMTIVDQQHAAQYVTKKGKQFKFDAVECMFNDLSENGKENIALFLVADYDQPGSMTNALEATYLISQGIKSPMGAFLSSFKLEESAAKTKENLGGELYNWQEMLAKYQVQP